VTAEVTRRRRLALPTTAITLGALTLALFVLYVTLAHLTHQLTVSQVTPNLGILALPILGVVVARRQPANPIGWILAGLGVGFAFYSDAGRYSVLDYHFHHGDLPLGPVAALVASELWVGFFLALPASSYFSRTLACRAGGGRSCGPILASQRFWLPSSLVLPLGAWPVIGSLSTSTAS